MGGIENDEINELKQLDVNAVQQEDLEKDLNAKLNKTIAENEDAIDQKRLEKAESKLLLLKGKAEALQRRIQNPYTKISEKTFIQKQINDLESRDIAAAENDIAEINLRRQQRRQQLDEGQRGLGAGDAAAAGGGRLPNESERDFLVRTGKITAFGNTSSFNVEGPQRQALVSDVSQPAIKEEDETAQESAQQRFKKEDAEYVDGKDEEDKIEEDEEDVEEDNASDSDFVLSDVELDDKKQPKTKKGKHAAQAESEDEYEDLDYEEPEIVEDNASLLNIDDGDELIYQKRLKNWAKDRQLLRESEKAINKIVAPGTEEWLSPHPEYNDAVLNNQFRVPGNIFANLFDYQKTCVQWLWELYIQKVGGIIGDEMGLGKTIQVISFLASLHYSKQLTLPVLIVCPSTVMKQWVNEFHTWWPPFRAVILHSIGAGMQNESNKDVLENELYELVEEDDDDNQIKKSLSSQKLQARARQLVNKVFDKGHVVITTYAGLKIYSDILLKRRWGYVVLDEGHKIRNPNAEVSLTAKRLRTPHRIILSGTPIQNNLTELWSLFDFIYPGKLGTLPIFQQEFVIPINMGGYANASNVQVQASFKCAIALKTLISPYLLRRLKSDVAKDLPKKTEMVLFCKLTSYQQRKYLDFLKSSVAESILNGKRNSLYGIDILKKICNHPDLLLLSSGKHLKNYNEKGAGNEAGSEDEGPVDDEVRANYKVTKKSFGDPAYSGKMQVLKTLILLWKSEGHKILLFTQTKQMLNILESFMQKLGTDGEDTINYLRMDGSTPIKDRQTLMDKFNSTPALHLFLLTTRVGGLGVNLIGANRVIIFDPDWNPSTDIQARERAWRLGQKKDVTIYRLMTKGTIEEKIYQRQIFKQFLSNKVLKDPNSKRVFKMNELNDLFTYGNEDEEDDEIIDKYSRDPGLKSRIVTKKNAQSARAKADDFHKVANITGVAKLETFNTGEGENDTGGGKSAARKGPASKPKKDEDRILGDLLESSGIKASIQEDVVENSSYDKNSIVTKEADRVAREAVSSLSKSRKLARQHRIGTPTWTGKFGSAGRVMKKKAAVGGVSPTMSARSSRSGTPIGSGNVSGNASDSSTGSRGGLFARGPRGRRGPGGPGNSSDFSSASIIRKLQK